MLGISGSPTERASMRLVMKRKRSLSPEYSVSAQACKRLLDPIPPSHLRSGLCQLQRAGTLSPESTVLSITCCRKAGPAELSVMECYNGKRLHSRCTQYRPLSLSHVWQVML